MTQLLFQPSNRGGTNIVLEYRPGQTTSLHHDASTGLMAVPTDSQGIIGSVSANGPVRMIGATWRYEAGDRGDGVIATLSAIDGKQLFITRWTAVLPAGATGFRLPYLPPDVAGVWDGNPFIDTFFIKVVDTPALSYREFRRDAEPMSRVSWIFEPTAPATVRIGM